jgi:hypothetical protein
MGLGTFSSSFEKDLSRKPDIDDPTADRGSLQLMSLNEESDTTTGRIHSEEEIGQLQDGDSDAEEPSSQ